jgi:hypothetical protein
MICFMPMALLAGCVEMVVPGQLDALKSGPIQPIGDYRSAIQSYLHDNLRDSMSAVLEYAQPVRDVHLDKPVSVGRRYRSNPGWLSQPSTEACGARLSPWIIFQEAGFYETPYGMFPKLQIYTIKELSPELNQSFPGSVQPVSRRPLEKSLVFKMS